MHSESNLQAAAQTARLERFDPARFRCRVLELTAVQGTA